MKFPALLLIGLLVNFKLLAQGKDSTVQAGTHIVTLSEVVVNTGLNVNTFINRIREDSSFYKAFKNLRLLGFTSINDIRMLTADGGLAASLHSKTRQFRQNGCRSMTVLEESTTGSFYDANGGYDWYTAAMYASLFFTKDTVCGETNIIGNNQLTTSDKKGMEKHKAQLKMLFFNPGKRITGLPFMSSKTEIFGDDLAPYYDMDISLDLYNNHTCYVLHQKVKPGYEDDVVMDEMTTWFNDSTYEVEGRNYSLSYAAAVYDFKVSMEVKMTRVNGLMVPSLIRYNGNWKAIFKKRERGVFTATLFDFE